MKKQYGRILAVLMAVAMVLSMFCFTALADSDDTFVGGTDVVATQDEATADEATQDETTQDEATQDETTQDETTDVTTDDETTADEAVYLLGDTDLSGKVNVKDATLIQKAVADLIVLSDVQVVVADTFADGKVNVKDATEIQKFIADLPANALIGTPVSVDDNIDATDDEVATEDEATQDEATQDEATQDETTADEATTDEATADEVVVKYYLVGWINNTDCYTYDYELVDGTLTIEITSDSYFAVMDSNGTIFWTDGWLDFNPTTAVFGEYGGNNNKFHVSAGTVTVTWDAETFTLTRA